MMGSLPAQQNSLFYDFRLERHIAENHLLRHIDRFLDFDRIPEHLEPFYSHTGRPSIDPELMIRMLLVVEKCVDAGLVKGEGFATDARGPPDQPPLFQR